MAKKEQYKYNPIPKSQRRPENPEPAPFTPEWNEKYRDEILKAASNVGDFKLVSDDEFKSEVERQMKAMSTEQALQELGITPDVLKTDNISPCIDVTELVDKVAMQIDMLYGSSQWKTRMSPKMKAGLHAVRVFIRQMRNETPPINQAGCLADLMKDVQIPEGVFGHRGEPVKPIKVTDKHFRAAGIV